MDPDDPIVTLTTDFGRASPYVAAVKGVILGRNPRARLVDLSHEVPPQDLQHTSYFLRASIPYFPAGTIHVVVVDPGVGTERAVLYVELLGQRMLVPDNGCWTEMERLAAGPPRVVRVENPVYLRYPVSSTFHGRDVFAPIAGQLSLGLDPALLGPEVKNWVRLDLPVPHREENRVVGEVAVVDTFGNLITNIPQAAIPDGAAPARVRLRGVEIAGLRRTYGDAQPGEILALISSFGLLEIAVAHGNAAARLATGVGAPVEVLLGPEH